MSQSRLNDLPHRFRAVRTHVTEGRTESRLETLGLDDLSAGEVVVRNRYAGVNFKDCLSLHGRAKIINGFPRVAGIELVGQVVQSALSEFQPGQTVFVHGFQTGIAYDGGFSEYVRVPAGHLSALPQGLNAEEVAMLGVPAFTAAMALERFQLEGLRPESGPVAISGAGGAVGLTAIAILARTGHQVTAITRRMEQAEGLRAAGATEVLDATELLAASPRALEKPRFAAAIDNVGGPMLSWLLRSVKEHGCVASVGNAASNDFQGSVLPFIMRSVKLVGIVANAPWEQRRRLWARLGAEWKPDFACIAPHVHYLRLDELLEVSVRQLAGKNSGRSLIRF